MSRRLVAQHTRERAAKEARVADEMGRGLEGGDVSFDIERIVLHNLLSDRRQQMCDARGVGVQVRWRVGVARRRARVAGAELLGKKVDG